MLLKKSRGGCEMGKKKELVIEYVSEQNYSNEEVESARRELHSLLDYIISNIEKAATK